MRIALASGTPAELVTPEADRADRGLVVIPDVGGLRPLFDDHVARLSADTGWAVCAYEPFPGREDMKLEERLAAMAELSDERMMSDAVAAADATGCETVGILGFCMGGMFTYKAAGTGRFHRAVSFYGMIRLPAPWGGVREDRGDPLGMATVPGACPVLAIVGTIDPYTPLDEVADAEAAGVTVVRYEGRDHGFVHDPSRPVHDVDDAADAWRRALAFLAE